MFICVCAAVSTEKFMLVEAAKRGISMLANLIEFAASRCGKNRTAVLFLLPLLQAHIDATTPRPQHATLAPDFHHNGCGNEEFWRAKKDFY
jgi:bacterioferritin-associated ferredoxin